MSFQGGFLLSLNESDRALELWHQAAFAIGCLILLLLTSILLIRVNRSIKDRQRRHVTEVWKPLLERCASGPQEILPRIPRRHYVLVLDLWNDCYASGSEVSTDQLIRMARRIGIDRIARDLLRTRRVRHRILAVITLGRLRDRSAWNEVSALVAHQNAFLAFNAAHALLLIDPEAAVPFLVPLIGRRADWSPLKIASMLTAGGSDAASDAIAQAATTGDPIIGARLLRHLPVTHSPHGLSILRRFLNEHAPVSDDILASCLFVFGEFRDTTDLPMIRQSLFHPAWYVRVQAAAALGKLGTEEDEARLTALLNDPEWWVRYRAGEALAILSSMTEKKLEALQETFLIPEAQEILATALAKFRQRRHP